MLACAGALTNDQGLYNGLALHVAACLHHTLRYNLMHAVIAPASSISQDVDGLHPVNVAALSMGRAPAGRKVEWDFEKLDFHVPPTPQGCIELLDRRSVQVAAAAAETKLQHVNFVMLAYVCVLVRHKRSTDQHHPCAGRPMLCRWA